MSAPLVILLGESVTRTGDNDDLEHYYCYCTPDLGLCGTDVSGADDVSDLPDTEETCVVCVDLIDAPCRFCGEC